MIDKKGEVIVRWLSALRADCGVDSSGTQRGPGTELLKAKVLVGAPAKVEKPFWPTFWQKLLTSLNTTKPKEWGSWNSRTRVTSKQQRHGVWIWALGLWRWSRVRVLLARPMKGSNGVVIEVTRKPSSASCEPGWSWCTQILRMTRKRSGWHSSSI